MQEPVAVRWIVDVAATIHESGQPLTIYAAIPHVTGRLDRSDQTAHLLGTLDYGVVTPSMITRVSTIGPQVDEYEAADILSRIPTRPDHFVSARIVSVVHDGEEIASDIPSDPSTGGEIRIDQDGDIFIREPRGAYRWYQKKAFADARMATRHLAGKPFIRDKALVAAVCRVVYGESDWRAEGLDPSTIVATSRELGHG